jgi:hypothetical protein
MLDSAKMASRLGRLQAEMRSRSAASRSAARSLAATKPKRAENLIRRPVAQGTDMLNNRMWHYLRSQEIAVEARRQARCTSPQSCLVVSTPGVYLTSAEWKEIGQRASAYLDSRGQ